MKNLYLIVILSAVGYLSHAHEGSHDKKSERKVKIEISENGFKPARIEAHKGENLILLVTRKTDKTCMTELKGLNGLKNLKLPLNKEVEFKVGKLSKTGDIQLLCGMDMKAGVVSVQ